MTSAADIALLLPIIIAKARRLTRDRDLGDDVASETIYRAFTARESCQGNTEGWLHQILHNTFKTSLTKRARYRKRVVSLEDEGLFVEPAVDDQEAAIELTLTLRKLQSLPKQYRVPLELAAVGGLSYPEIAGMLGIPVGTVRSRISRAREALSGLAASTQDL